MSRVIEYDSAACSGLVAHKLIYVFAGHAIARGQLQQGVRTSSKKAMWRSFKCWVVCHKKRVVIAWIVDCPAYLEKKYVMYRN